MIYLSEKKKIFLLKKISKRKYAFVFKFLLKKMEEQKSNLEEETFLLCASYYDTKKFKIHEHWSLEMMLEYVAEVEKTRNEIVLKLIDIVKNAE